MTTPKPHRRAALGAVAAASLLASPAIAQSSPTIRWRLTSSFPKQLDTIFGTNVILAKYLAEATDNRFQLLPFGPGEIVPGFGALDAVQNNTVECAQTALYFYTGKEPALAVGTGLPFGLNARLQNSWWQFGGGETITNEILARFNVVSFASGNSGAQMGGFFRKELQSPADLQGLKFRIGGLGGQVLAKLGAVPQQLPAGDVYPALERGTLDAAEFVGPADDEKLGFGKVAKYYYAPGWWEGGAMMHLVVNKDRLAELPPSYRAILAQACEAANNWMLGKYDASNPPALRRMLASGIELRVFPQSIMEASLKAANELYAELSAKNADFKRAYDSMMAFRTEALPWWQLNELNYDIFMARTRGRS
ncbi:TRAP transporter substrate-binding protein [Enterovirga rhinocerotis]|uniref:TRAP-type mannitol/chloroaromatic compound transport system substrate-binding protein n=1 Tax=Enterovirga rhinocerotis TaxID=1339210 RepID=A0A4R7CCC0_9HYPH|nr:ABC transporter substrate-binding protein [Enterovirga rhinocerotis]TDR94447.1 TRAP-type mannitol/chloroaromatic compound transport system substrate-binding protein [Enterovirga rhinocerotis]